MIRIVIFNLYAAGPLSQLAAVRRVNLLDQAGHNVKRHREYNAISMRMFTVEAWLEFETEEEAAMFKLTHL